MTSPVVAKLAGQVLWWYCGKDTNAARSDTGDADCRLSSENSMAALETYRRWSALRKDITWPPPGQHQTSSSSPSSSAIRSSVIRTDVLFWCQQWTTQWIPYFLHTLTDTWWKWMWCLYDIKSVWSSYVKNVKFIQSNSSICFFTMPDFEFSVLSSVNTTASFHGAPAICIFHIEISAEILFALSNNVIFCIIST